MDEIVKRVDESMKKYYYAGVGAILATLTVYVFFFGVVERFPLSNDTSVWGAFGSYFGGVVSPVLSFLAFVILAKTFKAQQDVLKSQQNEAERQRKFSEIELKTQALENMIVEFDALINANDTNSIKSRLEGSVDDKDDDKIKKQAEVVAKALAFISFYITDLKEALEDYYQDKTGFMTLSFQQRWSLKYSTLAKNAVQIIDHQDLTKNEWACLHEGPLLK